MDARKFSMYPFYYEVLEDSVFLFSIQNLHNAKRSRVSRSLNSS
jgi:hypothetical protein